MRDSVSLKKTHYEELISLKCSDTVNIEEAPGLIYNQVNFLCGTKS